jgi:hypothetical protein
MPNLSLARALQIKKRLTGRLAKANAELTSYNSQVAGEDEVDVKKIDVERKSLVAAILFLKNAIHKANVEAGIQAKVFNIGEKRAEATLLQTLPTRHGNVATYRAEAVEYKAYLRKTDVDQMIRTLEAEIDDLQQEINEANATKKIELPSEIVALTR